MVVRGDKRALERNFDLIRDVAMELERLQRSPPEAIVLDIAAGAASLQTSPLEFREALETLSSLALIEGAGRYGEAWLFRRLTAKGEVFLDEVRNARRWRRIKADYGRA